VAEHFDEWAKGSAFELLDAIRKREPEKEDQIMTEEIVVPDVQVGVPAGAAMIVVSPEATPAPWIPGTDESIPTPKILDNIVPVSDETRTPPDPDRFLMLAKRAVVMNYNKHRDPQRSQELTMGSVYIVWFSKTLGNWKAIVASPVARSLFWEITYNGHKSEVYVDIYKKLNNVKIPLGELNV